MDRSVDKVTNQDQAVAHPLPCADVFDDAHLPIFQLTIATENLARLEDLYNNWRSHLTGTSTCPDPTRRGRTLAPPCVPQEGFELKQYVDAATFQYNDETYTGIQIRLKGTYYFTWAPISPKMQFVIKFPKVASFHGLRHVVLDAPWYDPTLLRERLATHFARDVGLVAACVNNARLYINGQYYGLYAHLEYPDEVFLQRNFPDPSGNLWKDGLTLEEGTDNRDLQELFATTDVSTLEGIADVDEWVNEWAFEAALPHHDGYWCAVHNWLNYHDPARGWLWLPYDMDTTFGWLTNLDEKQNPMSCAKFGNPGFEPPFHYDAVLARPAYAGKYKAALRRYLVEYEPTLQQGRLDAWSRQIRGAALADPHKIPSSIRLDGDFVYVGTYDEDIAQLRDYLARRRDFLASYLSP